MNPPTSKPSKLTTPVRRSTVHRSAQMGAMLSNLVARLEEHGAEKDDRVGDVFEERGGR